MKSKEQAVKSIITKKRDVPITKKLLKKSLFVYNGNTIVPVQTNKNLIGTKLGALSLTKKTGRLIHNSERNRKRKNKKKQKK